MSFIEKFHMYINAINDPLWNIVVIVLLGTGIYFTLTTFFVQIRLLPQSFREMLNGRSGDTKHAITPFQAFVTGLASRVGTGNIAGVAIAISLGGAGAVFWMWITALVGMSSAFAESSLAQLFKVKDKTGIFRGGPAYYITYGLKQRWFAYIFAISLIATYGFVFNAIQSNTIADAAKTAWDWSPEAVGIALVLITAPMIFGGIRRISRIAEVLVPIMALLYLLLALYILVTNISLVPAMFSKIFREAFNFQAAAGGFLGGFFSQAMLYGIKRGLFSNEAGMGSAPNAAATAGVKHPASQGLIQMLGVFVDTIIICSCTAIIILLSGDNVVSSHKGAELTQFAIAAQVGEWGKDFLAIVIFMFAFSSIIGNYAYAESNISFLKNNRTLMTIVRTLVLAMVYFGAVQKVELVWDMGDTFMGTLALINLTAILLLSPIVITILKDYQSQLKTTKDPEFKLTKYPELMKRIKSDIWK
ncbi:sodium:alanine symporter family protein [Mergibacter septicus]|uniref:alanine/glycine:cation symporter family protein n=1 Tax=Mergibacter septicus TaxID=221402 RepID=UPI001C786AD8|nr:sodium:alanine symporter family protein [Mergibacter septicus]QDJ13504.1 sodium:alanine symporter family protein [Mergibacter septicus]